MGRTQGMPHEPSIDSPAAGTPNGDCAELARQLEAAQAEAADHKDRWMRSVAEFSNYRKRTEREWADVRASAGSDVIVNLLPVLDDLGRAFKLVPAELAGQPWVEGFRLIE